MELRTPQAQSQGFVPGTPIPVTCNCNESDVMLRNVANSLASLAKFQAFDPERGTEGATVKWLRPRQDHPLSLEARVCKASQTGSIC